MAQFLAKSGVFCISFVNSFGFAFDREKEDPINNGQSKIPYVGSFSY